MQAPTNLRDYVDSIRDTLKPPVSNKLLYSGEHLKVMIVAGPNQRNDFHVELGEELFYMLIGDMDLDIMENGQRKRIHIAEGTFFLLPACVPHSPQRYPDTIGVVVERERLVNELDCLRWYVPNTPSGEVLYEEVFHCTDLGTQIKAVIERFNAKQQQQQELQQVQPQPPTSTGSVFHFTPSPTDYFQVTATPGGSAAYPSFVLADQVAALAALSAGTEGATSPSSSSSSSSSSATSPTSASLSRVMDGEFKVDFVHGWGDVTLPCADHGEVFVWQVLGECEVCVGSDRRRLGTGQVTLCSRRHNVSSAGNEVRICSSAQGSVTVCITNTTVPPRTSDGTNSAS